MWTDEHQSRYLRRTLISVPYAPTCVRRRVRHESEYRYGEGLRDLRGRYNLRRGTGLVWIKKKGGVNEYEKGDGRYGKEGIVEFWTEYRIKETLWRRSVSTTGR